MDVMNANVIPVHVMGVCAVIEDGRWLDAAAVWVIWDELWLALSWITVMSKHNHCHHVTASRHITAHIVINVVWCDVWLLTWCSDWDWWTVMTVMCSCCNNYDVMWCEMRWCDIDVLVMWLMWCVLMTMFPLNFFVLVSCSPLGLSQAFWEFVCGYSFCYFRHSDFAVALEVSCHNTRCFETRRYFVVSRLRFDSLVVLILMCLRSEYRGRSIQTKSVILKHFAFCDLTWLFEVFWSVLWCLWYVSSLLGVFSCALLCVLNWFAIGNAPFERGMGSHFEVLCARKSAITRN